MKIHIGNFPDEIYIQLKEDYKNELFKQLSKFKKIDINNKLNITYSTLSEWKKENSFIPLKAIREIFKLIDKDDFNLLGKNVTNYKTMRGKYRIKNPKLPIKDSPELRAIILHMMCDGCFSSGYAGYYNINKKTKEEFVEKLNSVFGDVENQIYKDHVHFSSATMLILKNYFKLDFNSKKCRIPKKFFMGNREKLTAMIRAAIIDEGTIDGSNIRIDSCNKEFSNNLKKICEKLGYKCGKTWESRGPIFRFSVLAESIEQINKDMKNLPIKKKQALINLAIQGQKRGWKYKLPGEVKISIVKNLLKKPKRTAELIMQIELPKTTIGSHLRWLQKQGIVDYKINRNIRTYFIKNKLKAQKFIETPSNFIKSEKIHNYGLSQLQLLRMLNNKIIPYIEIERYFGFSKAALSKMISGLKKKDFIHKVKWGKYTIKNKGKKILRLNENEARYFLYANIREI